MEPVHVLALEMLGWGALTALLVLVTCFSWPFFITAIVSLCSLIDIAGEFKFVWENTRE
jgi:hypothetical protein